jgi:hypothetical protein
MTSNDRATLKAKTTPLTAATEQFGALFEESGQAMYLYLDDHNKACNQRFATLLGYPTPEAWAAVHTSFPDAFVAPKSQAVLVEAFQDAVNDGVAAQVPVAWKRKDGKTVGTTVILAPVDVDGCTSSDQNERGARPVHGVHVGALRPNGVAHRFALGLFAALLLAGCGTPSPAPQEAANERLARPDANLSSVLGNYTSAECLGVFQASDVPAAAVLPELPKGYEPSYGDTGVDTLARLQVFAYACGVVVIGNVTEADVSIAHTGVYIGNGSYQWEVFVQEPAPHAVAALLGKGGWPVRPASFARTPLGVEVSADDITYAINFSPRQVGHPQFGPPRSEILHYVTPDGSRLQIRDQLDAGTQALYGSLLEAHGGVLQRIADRIGPGSLVGLASDVNSTLMAEVYAPER